MVIKTQRKSSVVSDSKQDRKRSDSRKKSVDSVKDRKKSMDSVKSNGSFAFQNSSDKKKVKPPTKYIISKQTPTLLSAKVEPVICEKSMNTFVACGNTIMMYSLQTGLLIKTLRSCKTATSKSSEDAHKTNIIMLAIKDESLFSLCS